MNMAFKTKTWSVVKSLNKTTIYFEISNFGEAKLRLEKGEYIRSEEVSVGRSAFFVDIFPCGVEDADVGKISAFLMNNSNHGVLVDISITLGEESKAVVNKKMSKKEVRDKRALIF